jgi:translation initiation factor 2 gamma subunit (eIF-2gamma)
MLATQAKDQAIKAIQNAITLIKEGRKVERAVMEMLSFMIEESTLESVLVCIDAITDENINQFFDPIRDVIDTLEPPRKEHVQAFACFFEEHKDKAKLKEELAQISNT